MAWNSYYKTTLLVEVENSLPASSKAKLVSINKASCGGHSFEKLQNV